MVQTKDLGTRERILAVAERMFAEVGYRAVSLRSITRESGVNLAAIHYHFGPKEALLEAIFAKRCGPMNARRLELLTRCRERPEGPPLLEQIIEAYLRPSLVWPDDPEGARRFLRLRVAVAHEEQELSGDLISRHFDVVSRTFMAALRKVVPHLGEEEFYWRFHFLLGAHYYTLSNPRRIIRLTEGRCDPSNPEVALEHMVRFFADALRAPPVEEISLVFGEVEEAMAGQLVGKD